MSGLVKFDSSGFRSDITLEILSQTERGFDIVSQMKIIRIFNFKSIDCSLSQGNGIPAKLRKMGRIGRNTICRTFSKKNSLESLLYSMIRFL